MPHLIVNPGTPQAWEAQLKPGANLIGRGDSSDVRISDPSVSGSHCQIILENNQALIKDLRSTNGTFIDNAPIQEAVLDPGRQFRLGGVEIVLAGEPVAPASPPAPTVRLRIGAASTAPPPLPSMQVDSGSVATSVNEPPPVMPLSGGAEFCKFHSKSPAKYFCGKCNRYFCDLCVTTRAGGREAKTTCRSCGVECVPVQMHFEAPVQRSFIARLPGALIYPFRGIGILVLICAAIAFAALGFLAAGLIAIGAKVVFYGFLFLFMQNIIQVTVADEKEDLSFPSPEGLSGMIGAAVQFAGTVVMSFWLAIGLVVARFYNVEIPVEAIIGSVILGCLYFPMAFLAVAMKDSVLSANPLVVVPTILKIPFQYLIAVVLLICVFGVRQLGSILSGIAGDVTFSTPDVSMVFISLGVKMLVAFINVYLLTVNMRILGLLYNANKEKFGWF